jgi:hypothetical protein
LDPNFVVPLVRPLVESLKQQFLPRAKEPDNLPVELRELPSDHPGTQPYVARLESIPPGSNGGLRRPSPASALGIARVPGWLSWPL